MENTEPKRKLIDPILYRLNFAKKLRAKNISLDPGDPFGPKQVNQISKPPEDPYSQISPLRKWQLDNRIGYPPLSDLDADYISR
jgi:hypothetical protein